jgi:hypothetical protein
MLDGLAGVFTGYGAQEKNDATKIWGEAEVREARHVTEDEARWLSARLERSGTLHANEKALLAFLQEKAVYVHPSLRAAIGVEASPTASPRRMSPWD